MNEPIDKTIFLDLIACTPEDVVSRTGCRFDKSLGRYFINVWGHSYAVDLKKFNVQSRGPEKDPPRDYLCLFILYYLMKAKKIRPSGKWISEKDIPGGAAFFRGPHIIPSYLITNRFKDDIRRFQNVCEAYGGIRLDLADAAFLLPITPILPVAVLYWQGDEDFSSEAKLLFDRTIEQHLPLDIIWALAVEICRSLGRTS